MSRGISDAREAALYVLGRCRRFSAWSQQALQKAAEKYSLDKRDAALCSRLCLLVLQNAALCDYYIGCFSEVNLRKVEPQVLDILRLGACQILFMDKIPPSAAVHQAVEQAKRSSPRASGYVNAVLRRIAEKRADLPEIPGKGTPEELSIRYSHPLWLSVKLVEEIGYDHTKAFLAANNTEPGLTLSVNRCRSDTVSLKKKLADAGLAPRDNPLLSASIDLDSQDLLSIPGFSEGEFFVQDAAAACAVIAAAPRQNMRILDACAAPGGKSFLCASLIGDTGEILACDLHAKKLSRIEEGAERMGLHSIRTAPMDASRPFETLWNSFDLVVADVPCSGLGVIRKKPEIRYKEESALKNLPEVQQRILNGVCRCVRPGGILLFSTCTILREENEENAEAFLSAHPEFVRLEERTIWPQDYGTDGFYYCKMRRNA